MAAILNLKRGPAAVLWSGTKNLYWGIGISDQLPNIRGTSAFRRFLGSIPRNIKFKLAAIKQIASIKRAFILVPFAVLIRFFKIKHFAAAYNNLISN